MPLSLNKAQKAKINEFYTLLPDIEEELFHYKKFLKDRTIYCCCDNPKYSKFFQFFRNNLIYLKIKKVIFTCLKTDSEPAYHMEITPYNKDQQINELIGTGSYDSPECARFLQEADIIVTNPPFSESIKFIKFLIKNNKDFIIVGNRNTIITRDIFQLFMNRKIRFGFGFKRNTAWFNIPKELYGYYGRDVVRKQKDLVRFRNVTWYTTLDINVPQKVIKSEEKYTPDKYQRYDQYNAINIDRIDTIPIDYKGVMGVPITILDRFDFKHYHLLGLDRYMPENISGKRFTINGKEKYARILIKRK